MKKFWKVFLFRGLICASGGPLVLAIIYGILSATGTATQVSTQEVCIGIITITLMAFVVAGMTAIYQQERLPLPIMILIHGGVLYLAYILTYLLNGWLQGSLIPILVFSGIFIAGYALIWVIIYYVEKAKAEKINQTLKSQN